jgi:hypothetical protein
MAKNKFGAAKVESDHYDGKSSTDLKSAPSASQAHRRSLCHIIFLALSLLGSVFVLAIMGPVD